VEIGKKLTKKKVQINQKSNGNWIGNGGFFVGSGFLSGGILCRVTQGL
jgi:hypothetical protein